MSKLDDFISAVSAENANAIKIAGAAFDLVAQGVGLVTGNISLGQFLGILQPADQNVLNAIQQLQAIVTQGTYDIELQDYANSVNAQMGLIDNPDMDNATTAFANLQTYYDELPSDDAVNTAIQLCLPAVTGLTNDAEKWRIGWTPAIAANDTWTGDLSPPHAGGFVFSYVYALPQFVHAIFIFLSVISLLKPQLLTNYLITLSQAAGKLDEVHQRIIDSTSSDVGIIQSRIPSVDQVVQLVTTEGIVSWATVWENDSAIWPYGAWERYSQGNTMGSYFPLLGYQIDPRLTPIPDSFCKLVEARVLQKCKDLYVEAGLGVARDAMNTIRSLTNQPVSPRRYTDLSLRELLSTLGISPASAGVFQSLRTFLKGIPPYAAGQSFTEDGAVVPPVALPSTIRGIVAGN
jgi:hypothetical protein